MTDKRFPEPGLIKAHTATGSVYEFDAAKTRVRRTHFTHKLREDRVWLKLYSVPRIEVGTPMVFFMQPLGDGNTTIRTTSPVTRIEGDK